MQSRDAAVASLFVLLFALFLLLILIYQFCKQRYRRPVSMFRVDPCVRNVANIEDFVVAPPFDTPRILCESDDSPPDYVEDLRGASPLPSYEDVLYCDQVNRSFHNLLSTS